MRNKGIQLSALLAVMLLVAVAFTGVAASSKEIKKLNDKKRAKGLRYSRKNT